MQLTTLIVLLIIAAVILLVLLYLSFKLLNQKATNAEIHAQKNYQLHPKLQAELDKKSQDKQH